MAMLEDATGDSMFHRCGNPDHLADKCRFKDVTCHKCGKLGLIRSVCRSKKRDPSGRMNSFRPRPVKLVQENDGSDCDYPLLHFNSTNHAQPIKVLITTDRQSVTMEVDTGAALALISETMFKELWPDRSFSATSVILCSNSGETIPVLGSIDTEVRYKGQRAYLTLFVVKGTGPSLVGRNWLQCLKIYLSDVNCVNEGVLHKILQRFNSVFQDGLGTFQGSKVTISIEPGAQPRFLKATDQFLMHSTRKWTLS